MTQLFLSSSDTIYLVNTVFGITLAVFAPYLAVRSKNRLVYCIITFGFCTYTAGIFSETLPLYGQRITASAFYYPAALLTFSMYVRYYGRSDGLWFLNVICFGLLLNALLLSRIVFYTLYDPTIVGGVTPAVTDFRDACLVLFLTYINGMGILVVATYFEDSKWLPSPWRGVIGSYLGAVLTIPFAVASAKLHDTLIVRDWNEVALWSAIYRLHVPLLFCLVFYLLMRKIPRGADYIKDASSGSNRNPAISNFSTK